MVWVFAAVVGVCVVLWVGMRLGQRLIRAQGLARHTKRQPTSLDQLVDGQRCRVLGQVRVKSLLTSPVHQQPCVAWTVRIEQRSWLKEQRQWSTTTVPLGAVGHGIDFELANASGAVIVATRRADLVLVEREPLELGVVSEAADAVLERISDQRGYAVLPRPGRAMLVFVEATLLEGSSVSVVGQAVAPDSGAGPFSLVAPKGGYLRVCNAPPAISVESG